MLLDEHSSSNRKKKVFLASYHQWRQGSVKLWDVWDFVTGHNVKSTYDWHTHNILYNEVIYSLILFLNFDWFPPKFNFLTVIYTLFWTVAFETNLAILQECCFSVRKIPDCNNLKVYTSGYVCLGICFWICSIKHFFWFWVIFENIESHHGRNISMLFIAVYYMSYD